MGYFSRDYSRLEWVSPRPPKMNSVEIAEARFLQARCPSCHPTSSVKALKGGSPQH